jgi:hypothetical protein
MSAPGGGVGLAGEDGDAAVLVGGVGVAEPATGSDAGPETSRLTTAAPAATTSTATRAASPSTQRRRVNVVLLPRTH